MGERVRRAPRGPLPVPGSVLKFQSVKMWPLEHGLYWGSQEGSVSCIPFGAFEFCNISALQTENKKQFNF